MNQKVKTRIFSDLDADLTQNPVTNDVSKIYDDNAIRRSLKSLILCNHYDHPFHPEIYSPINELLFQNFTLDVSNILQRLLTDLINTYEPRVHIDNIEITQAEEQHSLNAVITYRTMNNPNPITYTVLLQRLR